MWNSNKIKLLDNYQIYQLINNGKIDIETKNELKREFISRNLSEIEKERLSQKYQLNHLGLNCETASYKVHPLLSSFFLNRQFRNLAILKSKGKHKEARALMRNIYLGLFLCFIVIFLTLRLFGSILL